MTDALTWWRGLKGIEKAAVVSLTVIAALFLGSALGLTSGGEKVDDLTTQARVQCHAHVKQRLKAPSTADFDDGRESGGPQGPWKIAGTVDSENDFGAKIRSAWTCDIAKTANGWDVAVNVR